MLKLLFSMMFGWTSQRFQSLYEARKIDNPWHLRSRLRNYFISLFWQWILKNRSPCLINLGQRSNNLRKDPDVNQEHLDTIKSEMFGDFLQGLNSLEYSATQFEYFSDGSTSYDLPKILQGISLQDIIKLGSSIRRPGWDGWLYDFSKVVHNVLRRENMKKRTIGQVLRLSRVNLHLSLQDVSNKTAIEIPYIEALENDEFDLLPSPFTPRSISKVSMGFGIRWVYPIDSFSWRKRIVIWWRDTCRWRRASFKKSKTESELVTNPVLSTSEFCHPWFCDLYRIFL